MNKSNELPMDEKLRALLVGATDVKLFNWTDPKFLGRGYCYLDKVDGLIHVEGQGIVACVHGTSDYYTKVFVGDTGDLEAVCSCPVGHRCKHAIAIILSAAKILKAGECVVDGSPDCDICKSAEAAFSAAKSKFAEREKSILEQRLAKEKEKEDCRRWLEKERSEALALFASFLQNARDCYERGDYDGVLKVLDEACDNTDDDFDITPYGGELYDILEEISKVATEALKRSKMSDVEKLIFAHDVETPYRYYESPHYLYESFWENQNDLNIPKEVWLEVAETLMSRLDDGSLDINSDYHAFCHTIKDACTAYWNAGRGEDAFDLRRRFATKTYGWYDCADDLCRLGRREEAKTFILEARERVRNPEIGEVRRDGHDLIDKLAKVYADEGNFAYATALMTENWLSQVGSLYHCGDRYGLERIMDMAGKAGCRNELFAAIAHAVDTRVAPSAILTNGRTAFPSADKPLSPPWPLPPSGLDLEVSSPLSHSDAHWWEAEAVLILAAIKEEWYDEAAQRFMALPSRPGGYVRVSNTDHLTDFEREVHAALSEKHPEVAAKIAALQESRLWSSVLSSSRNRSTTLYLA